jgi:hypothetical protein
MEPSTKSLFLFTVNLATVHVLNCGKEKRRELSTISGEPDSYVITNIEVKNIF